MVKIAYCQATYDRDADNTLVCVRNAVDYVDHIIIVTDGTVPEEKLKAISDCGPYVDVLVREFQGSLPMYRQHYVWKANELGVDWVIVSDPDEQFNETFWKHIRAKVEEADRSNQNLLGVRCQEQFEVHDWYDALDEAKESPAKARESTFYKNLVFKLLPGLQYKGVGVTGTVHETWTADVPWVPGPNLPAEMVYVHKKSALQVWRNAARNVILGGGGDNVGEMNPLWKPLLAELERVGTPKWQDFERFIESGQPLPVPLIRWVAKALTFSASNWGTEDRETAKWVVFHHRELLEDESIANGIANPPKMTKEEAAELAVTRAYFEVLHRHPDEGGKKDYRDKILEGKLTEQQLKETLLKSPEYAQKFGSERMTFQIPVHLQTEVSEELFMRAFQTSQVWWGRIKPRIDLGKLVESLVDDPQAYYRDVYEATRTGGTITFGQFVGLLAKHSPEVKAQVAKITAAMAAQHPPAPEAGA